MNIILIGGRGIGKTTISTILSKKLNKKRISTDAEIQQTTHQTIPEIIKNQGWHAFRDIEYEICKNIGNLNDVIVDTGGGVIIDLDANGNEIWSERKIQSLKKNGTTVLLTCSIDTQVSNILESEHRPSLDGKQSAAEEIEAVMNRRNPWYEKAADYVVDVDGKSMEGVADEVIGILGMRNEE